MRRAFYLIALVVLGTGSWAGAETKINLETGWGNFYRAARWNPIFVTLADPTPREVTLDVQAPYDRRYGMRIQQTLTIGPTPVRVALYVPLSWSLDATSVTVRAGGGGRQLAYATLAEDPVYQRQSGRTMDPIAVTGDQLFVGLTGSQSTERLVEAYFSAFTNTRIGTLEQSNLPRVPAGYDALDLLVLNQPDLSRMPDEQQSAIVDWVRSGGNLAIWPGATPIPATSPLVDALPCRVGETQAVQIDPKTLKYAGLPERFNKLTGRQLTPLAGAVPVKLFLNSGLIVTSRATTATSQAAKFAAPPLGYRGRAGFGQIVVLPVDASLLRFEDKNKSEVFWRRQLDGMVEIPRAEKSNNNNNNMPAYLSNAIDGREQNALSHSMDQMGNIPGAGTFGFSYISAVLILMMILVGPVDWVVLKMLKRQPWTWATTAGWAGVITLGAIFVGHAFKSGELHFRTASVVDEADGSRVAATDLAAIYSPRTTSYEIECDPESWWKPATEQMMGWGGGGGLQIDIPCHQDYHGNRLLPLSLSVWNLRFIEGVTYASQPAMIEAALTVKIDEKLRKRIVAGSITNRSSTALTGLVIRTGDGAAKVTPGEIGPGQTVPITALFDVKDKQFDIQVVNTPYYMRGNTPTPAKTGSEMAVRADLAGMRSLDIDKLLKKYHDTACVYAEFSAAPSTVKLAAEGAKEEHKGTLRSLVKIERQ
jgi:hypothetical protein